MYWKQSQMEYIITIVHASVVYSVGTGMVSQCFSDDLCFIKWNQEIP